MKTSTALAFAFLTLVAIATAPAPTEVAPELALPALAAADPTGISAPTPVPQATTCFTECLAIRKECDASCSTDQCYRECRDSAFECLSHC
ncbi:MAG TPA: hypothetical protein VG477_00955 [Thermoanaerobaculia bacterium]|nr:hypothetical protein [Thermoanaerobaculia bacterium]